MFRVYGVIPAAGSGHRMNLYPPKQFQLIDDKPIISYAIDAFEKMPWMEKVIVVTAVDDFEKMRQIIWKWNHSDRVVLVPGEDTRHGSIYNGVKYMESGHVDMPPDIVIVHDGCRIFVTESDLNTIATEAFKNGAAGYIRPLVSTVVSKDREGTLETVFDRTQCFASEMPQAFKYEYIKDAYKSASRNDIANGTECLLLVKKHCLGARIKLIDGGEHLWKITYQKDIYAAVGTVKENNSHMVFVGSEEIIWRNLLHAVTKSKDSCTCSTVSAIPKPTIRNVILCYQHFSVESLQMDTRDTLDYYKTNCMKNCTIICVISTSEPDSHFPTLRLALANLRTQLLENSVVIYAILTSKDPVVNVIGKAISSLIRDRNRDLTGQVFIF